MKGYQLRHLQPEFRQPASEAELEGVLRSELGDWLALEWFYPDGFEFERLVETPERFVCSGSQLEYVFPKRLQAGLEYSFAERFKQVAEIASNSQLLAADLVLGVKLLRWTDGELLWVEGMLPFDQLSIDHVSQQADEVALVLRRIPDGSLLSDVLSDEGELGVEALDALVVKLVNFHSHVIGEAQGSYSSSYINDTLFRRLQDFMDEYEGYLDLFSRVALKETENYLSKFFANNELLFRRRAKEGFVAASHGMLRAHKVVVVPLVPESEPISVVGRSSCQQDVLADIAALTVDLDLYEAEYLSAEILRRYQQLLPECFDEQLFKFYRVAYGVLAAIEAFSEAGAERTIRANQALGRALRVATSFPQKALLVVCGSAVGEAQGLAETLTELFALSYLSVEDLREGLCSQVLSDQALFDRFSSWGDRLLDEGGSLVAQWLGRSSALTPEIYHQIVTWAKSKNIPYRILRCDEFEIHEDTASSRNLARNSQLMLALQIAQSFSRQAAAQK